MTTPTIHVTLQVKNITADSYEDAKLIALQELTEDDGTDDLLGNLGIDETMFMQTCRVAKEANGTYTVTIP